MPSQSQWKAWVLEALGESDKPITVGDVVRRLAHRMEPALEDDMLVRKAQAALRKLGVAGQAVYEAGWGWALANWREHDRAEPETGSDHANRVRLEDLIAKLEAKAASSTFPHEAASLRAKVGELRRKLEAAP